MARIKVERPPECPECHVMMSYMDRFVISWQFRCPKCLRGYQVHGRSKIGWEKVDAMFIYPEAQAPRPYWEEPPTCIVVSEEEW